MKTKEYVRKSAHGTFYYRDPEMTVHHRERGLPAREYLNGNKIYLENDICHRLDGFADDWKYYRDHYLNGKKLFTKKK